MPEKDQKTKKSNQSSFLYQKPGPTVFEFTPQARKIWDTIPVAGRTKILNTVWCVNCSRFTTMVSYSGKVEKGDLILRGTCERCGHEVTRLVERG